MLDTRHPSMRPNRVTPAEVVSHAISESKLTGERALVRDERADVADELMSEAEVITHEGTDIIARGWDLDGNAWEVHLSF